MTHQNREWSDKVTLRDELFSFRRLILCPIKIIIKGNVFELFNKVKFKSYLIGVILNFLRLFLEIDIFREVEKKSC